jgi:predicted nucleic acid-binding protein
VAGVIVLDASVLIAYLDAEDAQHHRAESLLAREIDDQFAGNPLTLAEVLFGPARSGRLDEARTALRELEVVEQPFPSEPASGSLACGRIPGCGCQIAACCWPPRMRLGESLPSTTD